LTADANIVLKQAIAHLQAAIQESGAKITVERLPVVRMNEEQLLQVLLNLLGNAIKYRDAKTPEIHVSACREANAWRLAVSDNGIGIDPKHRERIFDSCNGCTARPNTKESASAWRWSGELWNGRGDAFGWIPSRERDRPFVHDPEQRHED